MRAYGCTYIQIPSVFYMTSSPPIPSGATAQKVSESGRERGMTEKEEGQRKRKRETEEKKNKKEEKRKGEGEI